MKTLTEAFELIEYLNEQAHDEAYDSWAAADELMDSADEDDWETAEEMREDASLEQSEYFRENVEAADAEERELIEYWLENDDDFRETFRDWYGHEEFDNEFE